MPDPAPKAELLRSLGRLVRGLSALFWGLPITLVVCVYATRAESLRPFAFAAPLVTTGLLVYGLWQLGDFQKQERVWRRALDHARLLSLINLGFSPFIYWWNRVPNSLFFQVVVMLMALSALLFLGSLNLVLRRLGAMLPDEALRLETRQFTKLNLNLLFMTLLLVMVYLGVAQLRELPFWLGVTIAVLERGSGWFLILLVLLPLAMTMALLWKTKEVILENVFGADQ